MFVPPLVIPGGERRLAVVALVPRGSTADYSTPQATTNELKVIGQLTLYFPKQPCDLRSLADGAQIIRDRDLTGARQSTPNPAL